MYRKQVNFGNWQVTPKTDFNPLIGLPIFLVFSSPQGLQQAHLGHVQRSRHRQSDGALLLRFDIANPLLGEKFKAAVVAALPTLMLSFGCEFESDLICDEQNNILSIKINSFFLHDN